VQAGVTDVKNTLSVFQSQISSIQATPRGLETHWRQEPVTLEDARGNILPIPLELVNSWDVSRYNSDDCIYFLIINTNTLGPAI
jgi:ABC-type phosphate transport system auxiliary subunit